jgi:6-phosphogluconolactonase
MQTKILSNKADYIPFVTSVIQKHVEEYIGTHGICSMLLTGGRVAESLYRSWYVSSPWDHRNMEYYFGDERCVSSDSPYSNYAMVVNSLFPEGIHQNTSIYKINGDADDLLDETSRYEKLLPTEIDILLLSVGEDGHIASLFPESNALYESDSSVVSIIAPKPPQCRFTITPKVINSAKNIFVFASGAEKGGVLAKALDVPKNINELPVRLTIGTTWILDENAYNAFNDAINN